MSWKTIEPVKTLLDLVLIIVKTYRASTVLKKEFRKLVDKLQEIGIELIGGEWKTIIDDRWNDVVIFLQTIILNRIHAIVWISKMANEYHTNNISSKFKEIQLKNAKGQVLKRNYWISLALLTDALLILNKYLNNSGKVTYVSHGNCELRDAIFRFNGGKYLKLILNQFGINIDRDIKSLIVKYKEQMIAALEHYINADECIADNKRNAWLQPSKLLKNVSNKEDACEKLIGAINKCGIALEFKMEDNEQSVKKEVGKIINFYKDAKDDKYFEWSELFQLNLLNNDASIIRELCDETMSVPESIQEVERIQKIRRIFDERGNSVCKYFYVVFVQILYSSIFQKYI